MEEGKIMVNINSMLLIQQFHFNYLHMTKVIYEKHEKYLKTFILTIYTKNLYNTIKRKIK